MERTLSCETGVFETKRQRCIFLTVVAARQNAKGGRILHNSHMLRHQVLAAMSLMDMGCRFAGECWRPLCPFVHLGLGQCARKWADLWVFPADEEARVAQFLGHVEAVAARQIQKNAVETQQVQFVEEHMAQKTVEERQLQFSDILHLLPSTMMIPTTARVRSMREAALVHSVKVTHNIFSWQISSTIRGGLLRWICVHRIERRV